MEASLQSLGVYSFADRSESDSHLDFRYTLSRVEMLRSRYGQLVDVITGILGVTRGELELEEAHASAEASAAAVRLTFVGLVFIPLAYCTGLFSIGDVFQPGNHISGYNLRLQFRWQYLLSSGSFSLGSRQWMIGCYE